MYTCHLLATLLHNPNKPETPPVVHRVQMASSRHTAPTQPPGLLEGCQAVVVELMVTDSLKSYQDAVDQMERYVSSRWCPSWVRTFLGPSSTASSEDVRSYFTMKSAMRAAKDLCTRPIYSQGGVFEPEEDPR